MITKFRFSIEQINLDAEAYKGLQDKYLKLQNYLNVEINDIVISQNGSINGIKIVYLLDPSFNDLLENNLSAFTQIVFRTELPFNCQTE